MGLYGDYFIKFVDISLVIILFLVSVDAGDARTVYVEPGNSIQGFVNNSTVGDLIVIKPGVYQENVTINVSGVKVISDPDSSGVVLIKSPDGNSSVFQIEADNVTVSGFNITGSGEEPDGLQGHRKELPAIRQGFASNMQRTAQSRRIIFTRTCTESTCKTP